MENGWEGTMNHTPGPWHVGPRNVTVRPSGFECVGKANGGCVICQLFGADMADNARIIAAAPELLEALEEMISVPMGVDDATVPAGKTPDDAPRQVVVNMSVSWARVLKARAAIAKARGFSNEGTQACSYSCGPAWESSSVKIRPASE